MKWCRTTQSKLLNWRISLDETCKINTHFDISSQYAVTSVVNNTCEKYCQYQYQYFGKKYCRYQYQYCYWKVLPIPIPILFWQYFFRTTPQTPSITPTVTLILILPIALTLSLPIWHSVSIFCILLNFCKSTFWGVVQKPRRASRLYGFRYEHGYGLDS